jgi:hypothetical protein
VLALREQFERESREIEYECHRVHADQRFRQLVMQEALYFIQLENEKKGTHTLLDDCTRALMKSRSS